MKVVKKNISQLTLDNLKGNVRKKIAGIVVPPNSIFQPQRNSLIASEITIELFDATWGYINIRYASLDLIAENGGLHIYVEKNLNLSEEYHQKQPLPTYGLNIEYNEFVISKIEIYGLHDFIDKDERIISDISNKINKKDLALEIDNHSLIIFTSTNGDDIVIKAETGLLLIGFDKNFKNEFLNREYNIHYSNSNYKLLLKQRYKID